MRGIETQSKENKLFTLISLHYDKVNFFSSKTQMSEEESKRAKNYNKMKKILVSSARKQKLQIF